MIHVFESRGLIDLDAALLLTTDSKMTIAAMTYTFSVRWSLSSSRRVLHRFAGGGTEATSRDVASFLRAWSSLSLQDLFKTL